MYHFFEIFSFTYKELDCFFFYYFFYINVQLTNDPKYNTHLNISTGKYLLLSDTSLESGLSDDYAVPPDAEEWPPRSPSRPTKVETIEKSGHLAKLGGKLKTWTRRWFQLYNAKLRYWKSQVCFNTNTSFIKYIGRTKVNYVIPFVNFFIHFHVKMFNETNIRLMLQRYLLIDCIQW